jgi:hypothetical protein
MKIKHYEIIKSDLKFGFINLEFVYEYNNIGRFNKTVELIV